MWVVDMVEFREPAPLSIQYVADTMRPADVVEVWASGGFTPLGALETSISKSQYAAVAWVDDEPCAIYGLIIHDALAGVGIPWMLASEKAMKHKREFLAQTPGIIKAMLDICPTLYNYVHAENRTSIRWLRWLGFEIEPALPLGQNGELFHRFHRERGH